MFGFDLIGLLFTISYGRIPVVFAITLHEVAHGWAAKQLGDPTAHTLGRLSLNPIRHVDPVGTVLVPTGLAIRHRRGLDVRLGKAGAGGIRQPAKSASAT